MPVNTEFDVENNQLYSEVDETGTYCIMDMEIWLNNIGIELPTNTDSNSTTVLSELKLDNSVAIQSQFDSQIFELNGHRYQLIDSLDLTWSDAREYCESVGGHLLTITSKEEQELIEKEVLYNGNKNAYWLGGYKDISTWKWTTDENFSYTNWSRSQPDNYRGCEDKLSIYRKPNPVFVKTYDSSNYWNDLNDSGEVLNENFFGIKNIGFICEWEPGKALYSILIPTRWKTITLKGTLTPNGKTDSDSDFLTDWEEIDTTKISFSNNKIVLPHFRMADLTNCLNRFNQQDEYNFLVKDCAPRQYLPIISDPTDKDSDDDGISAYYELYSETKDYYSNPLSTDSDRDGLDDYNDPQPSQKNALSNVNWEIWKVIDPYDYMQRRNENEMIFYGVHNVDAFNYHTQIIVFAKESSRYYEHMKFNNNAKNYCDTWEDIKYMTLGAGPAFLLSGDPLTADFNRTKDIKLDIKDQLTNITPTTNIGTKIQTMINGHNFFISNDEKNPDYILFPEADGEYNSNSYAHGLINLAQLNDYGGPQYNVPGYKYPVAAKWFGA